jgi:hypothetical protein
MNLKDNGSRTSRRRPANVQRPDPDDAFGREREWGVGDLGGGRGADFVGRGSFGDRDESSIEYGGWQPSARRYDPANGNTAHQRIRGPDERTPQMEQAINRYVDEAFDRRPGPHSGKGPKGWHRSDERIREDVLERLTRHGDVDATELEVAVENGEVTLSGTVADRPQKRAAERCAERVDGVVDVHNRIRLA